MRLLQVVTRSHPRGAELTALDLGDELRVAGVANRVVALGPAFDGTVEDRIPVLGHPTSRQSMASRCLALRRLQRSYQPDIVLAHGGAAAQVAALAKGVNEPLVVWQRIQQIPDGVLGTARSQALKLVVRRIDATVALTKTNQAELLDLGFKGPVWQIPNSRRGARFADLDHKAATAALRSELGLEDDVPLLGLVGHLIEQKRPERAVQVLAGVRAAGVPAHLVVAGNGPGHDGVVKAVRAAGLGPHVSMLGLRRDVPELLAALDVLLITSDAEGIPGVIIEAAMAGCHVVSFPFDGAAEVESLGLSVLDRPSVPEMVGVVIGLLADLDRLETLAASAKEAAARLSTERIARTYAERLEELLASARPSGRAPSSSVRRGRADGSARSSTASLAAP